MSGNELTSSGKSATSPTTPNALPDAWIDRLFARFAAMFGRLWVDQWIGADLAAIKAVWAEDLAGCAGEQLRAGIDALVGRPFPPSLPEFVALCRPTKTFDPEQLFVAAVRAFSSGQWPDRVTYWTAVRVGRFDVLGNPYSALRSRWLASLAEVRDMEARGELPGIPEPREALPAPGQTTLTREQAAETIAKLKAGLRRQGLRSQLRVIDGGPPPPEVLLDPNKQDAERRRQLAALEAIKRDGGDA